MGWLHLFLLLCLAQGSPEPEAFALAAPERWTDAGGELWRATPSGAQRIDDTRRWRHPIWDPNRNLLAIEGRDPVTQVTDIYLIELDP